MVSLSVKHFISLLLSFISVFGFAQEHPRIYVSHQEKSAFLQRMTTSPHVEEFVREMQQHVRPYVDRHQEDPTWIVSRLQMYWKTKFKRVYVNGMDFSHGEGQAAVPTVRFSGSRDWDTDYLIPKIEDILPYMDDPRGLYLQNGKKAGKPWEWIKPSETGHIVERINKKILDLAEDAAFLYWLYGDETYAVFATDILMFYVEGMYHRDPPKTVDNHKNRDLMGLQTFEVIHEGVIKPLTVSYDFLYDYLSKHGKDLDMIQQVWKKWADQEIKYGVPGNNWNLMQARYITYLALAMESDAHYEDRKGQEYYIDQVINQNSRKQKALKDVMLNFDAETGIWPEVAGYSIMVSDDIIEVFALMDKTLNNHLLANFPRLEKAILANFNYLFPNGFTTAYGDSKHSRLRFRALELLIAQYRKYGQVEKEHLITAQLKRFIEDCAYDRTEIKSLFHLFYQVEELADVPAAQSLAEIVNPTFYSANVSWIVQRNGNSLEDGMMISKNASLGNHSHANGINLELFAKGMVIAPDCAAGVSYWSADHKEYYSRFPAHNTVIVDGKSNYRTMNSVHAFELKAIYPVPAHSAGWTSSLTFSDVWFIEPETDAIQQRFTGTIRTSPSSGYFVDIFRSARQDKKDKKHEYIFHGQGDGICLTDFNGESVSMIPSEELSSRKGDLIGYDYFFNKKEVKWNKHVLAQYTMPSITKKSILVNLWMKGEEDRTIFTVEAPYSRAIRPETVPKRLYKKPLPTLIIRQEGEAAKRPFVSIIDVCAEDDENRVKQVGYFSSKNDEPDFVGIIVDSEELRKDYLYNHPSGKQQQTFDDGAFQGMYGVVAYQEDCMHSLFLGKGLLLEKGFYKIESTIATGNIYVEFQEVGIKLDADTPFRLTLPSFSSSPTPPTLSLTHESGRQEVFTGTMTQTNDQWLAVFDLPALRHTRLELSNLD